MAEGHGGEITEKLAQTIGFGIFVAVFGHLLEQRFGLRFEDGQLEKHGRVEHDIGIFLVRKYPFVLSGTNAGPPTDGFCSRNAPVFVVANDAAEQSIVGGGDIIVVV